MWWDISLNESEIILAIDYEREDWSGSGKRSQWIISSLAGLLEGFNLKIDHIKEKKEDT